eukprot:TRINITY_DN7661_c0_g3_i4.p1 TRINITY_DN7661_c0_g3~~TRINITY_DN7661_c0_g3_i4.p1  ORF type:complete len:454 (-),score=94.97 TRINITY_DN7661_c0_g3_i4:476-1837(-)
MSRTSVIISFLVVLFSFINTEEFSDTLEPFQQIRVCVPYTVKVQAASEPGTYRIDVDADQAVYDALKKNVNSEGELSLSSHGDFESQNPIKVTVVVPSQELTVVTTQGFSDVLIAGEFEVDNLTVVSGGPNAIFGDKLTVREFLQVKNSGVGDVVLGGSLEGEIDVVLAGIAEVFLKGVSGNVVLDGRMLIVFSRLARVTTKQNCGSVKVLKVVQKKSLQAGVSVLNCYPQVDMSPTIVDKQAYDEQWRQHWNDGVAPGAKWDTNNAAPSLLDIINGKLDMSGKRAVVPGCGRGYDVIALAQAGAAEAVGLELVPAAVEEAKKHRDSLNLPQDVVVRTKYEAVDFFQYKDSQGGFDVGYDYTFFCAIHPDMRKQWSETWFELIKPGGELITLIYPIDPERWPGPPWYVTPEVAKTLLTEAGFECEYLQEVPKEKSFAHRSGHEALGRWRKPSV